MKNVFFFKAEDGIRDADVTGVQTCALPISDTAGVTPVIENILRASARTQKATGVQISTHTWAAGRSGEAQQAIFAQEGVDLRRVIIGHSGDSDDLGYLRGLMERGSTIGMDRFGLEHYLPTEKRVEVLARLCAEGYAGKMVLSHDANCWTDMLSEDDKRRTRPLTSSPRSARRVSPRIRSSRCWCATPARSSKAGGEATPVLLGERTVLASRTGWQASWHVRDGAGSCVPGLS